MPWVKKFGDDVYKVYVGNEDSEAEQIFENVKIVTWADGTDEEIVAMVNAHYAGVIDIHDYWSVGDERTVSLSAIDTSGTGAMEAQSAQDVTLVLMNEGGKTLASDGITECAFIVGQKDCLSTTGAINTTAATSGWASSDRRTWCNNKYYEAIPSSLRSIFKEHYNYVADSYDATTPTQTTDYFCLPSAKEVLGDSACSTSSGSKANTNAEANNSQLEYYQTSANCIKNVSSTASDYWTSSKRYYTSSTTASRTRNLFITNAGATSTVAQNGTYGIAPQGVI